MSLDNKMMTRMGHIEEQGRLTDEYDNPIHHTTDTTSAFPTDTGAMTGYRMTDVFPSDIGATTCSCTTSTQGQYHYDGGGGNGEQHGTKGQKMSTTTIPGKGEQAHNQEHEKKWTMEKTKEKLPGIYHNQCLCVGVYVVQQFPQHNWVVCAYRLFALSF